MQIVARGRGRRAPLDYVADGGLPWPVHPGSRGPARAVVYSGPSPVAYPYPVVYSGPSPDPGPAATTRLGTQWGQMEEAAAAEDGDDRASSPASSTGSGSSGYSTGDVSASSENDDVWREREVYASVKYSSMGINLLFNYWSPISEDEEVLDELEARCSRSKAAGDPTDSEECGDTSLNTDSCPPVAQAAQVAPAASEHVYPLDGLSANALFAPQDALRRAAVIQANLLDWGGFSNWFPMPTLEEAMVLARIAAQEEAQLQKLAALKKLAKNRRYRRY